MKKSVLSILAISMTVSSAYADGGSRERSKSSLSAREFFCAIAGGAALGSIVKNVGGASDPVTFIGALIGGAIGVEFCKYMNDDKALGAQAAAFNGLDKAKCDSSTWESSKYRGTLRVLADSYRISGGGYGGDAGSDNTCRLFETTLVENSTGKRIGKTKAWACKSPHDQWVITDHRSVSSSGVTTCDGSRLPDDSDNRGSVSIGDGRDARTVWPEPVIDVNRTGFNWDLSQLRRVIDDYGIMRGLKIVRRTEFEGQVERGILKAISDDGRGVIIYLSPTNHKIVPIEDLGLECRYSGIVNNGLCRDVEVKSRSGIKGTLQYVFRNGDVVINAPNMMDGLGGIRLVRQRDF